MRRDSWRSVPTHVQAARRQRRRFLLGHVGGDDFALRVDFARRTAPRLFLLGQEPCGQTHFHVAAELNVGAAAGHVGGDGDGAGNARLRDDEGFLFVIARVQHLMLDFQPFSRSDRLSDFSMDVVPTSTGCLRSLQSLISSMMALCFSSRRAVDLVVVIVARHGPVGRDFEHFELVDVDELVGLGEGRAGHAGEFCVKAEVVLEGDGGERLAFALDVHVFLGFQRLMQPLRIAAAFHHAAGELVDDDDLVLLHDVITVALEQLVRPQRLIDVMHDGDVFDVVQRAFGRQQVRRAQQGLHMLVARFGIRHLPGFFVEFEIFLVEERDDLVDGVVQIRLVLDRAGNDQRRARFVDEDGVHLVHDGEVVARQCGRAPAILHHVGDAVFHVVAQVVEAEFVVGAVGDVRSRRLCGALRRSGHAG